MPEAGTPRVATTSEPEPAPHMPDEVETYLPNVIPRSLTLRRQKRAIVFNVQRTGLISTRHQTSEESRIPDSYTKLVPLVCVRDGKVDVGGACMAGMPGRARVRYSDGTMHMTEKTTHNGPACEADEFERGVTDGWLVPGHEVEGPALAIWPDDADVGIRVHGSQRIQLTDADRLAARINERPGNYMDQAFVIQAFDESLDGSGLSTRVISVSSLGPQPSARVDVVLLRGAESWTVGSDRPAYILPVVATLDIAGDGKRLLLIHSRQPDGVVTLVDDHGQTVYGYACASM